MIAKIKLDDREYFSYIYFLCKYDYKTKAIVFNDKENKFELIDAFKNKYTSERIIYLFDYNENGLIEKKEIVLSAFKVTDCMGYDWLINNEDLIRNIELSKEIPIEYINIAKGMNSKIDVYAWHDITTKEEADELMDIAGAFHDSYIRDFKGIFGRPYEPEFETKLQVSFEMYGNHFDIMLEFAGGIGMNCGFATNLNSIYLSSIVFHNGYIYWLDGGDELRPIDIKDHPYIMAQKLRWRIIDKLEK